jgi:hypothetical protein
MTDERTRRSVDSRAVAGNPWSPAVDERRRRGSTRDQHGARGECAWRGERVRVVDVHLRPGATSMRAQASLEPHYPSIIRRRSECSVGEGGRIVFVTVIDERERSEA